MRPFLSTVNNLVNTFFENVEVSYSKFVRAVFVLFNTTNDNRSMIIAYTFEKYLDYYGD